MSQSISFDRRRINGPEDSLPPSFSEDENKFSFLTPSRSDRRSEDIRPIFLKTGLISQSNGSAYIETGRTKIACAVYGPRQAAKNAPYNELGKLNVDVKFAPFSCTRRRVPNKDSEDRSVSILIQQALTASLRLELFPKSIIDVYINVLENDGIEGCISAGTVAASTALAHAGVEMVGLVMSCTASIVGNDAWVDPTAEESRQATGTVLVSCIPAVGTVTNTWQTGQLTSEQMLRCIGQAVARCNDIHQVVSRALREGAKASESVQ